MVAKRYVIYLRYCGRNEYMLAFENLKQKFLLEEHTNFLDYFSLIKSLPNKWKEIIKSQTQSKDTDTLLTKLCRAEKEQNHPK